MCIRDSAGSGERAADSASAAISRGGGSARWSVRRFARINGSGDVAVGEGVDCGPDNAGRVRSGLDRSAPVSRELGMADCGGSSRRIGHAVIAEVGQEAPRGAAPYLLEDSQ